MGQSDKDHESGMDASDVFLCMAANASSQGNFASIDISNVQVWISRQVRVDLKLALVGIDVAHVQLTASSQLSGHIDDGRCCISWTISRRLAIFVDCVVQLLNIGHVHGGSHVL